MKKKKEEKDGRRGGGGLNRAGAWARGLPKIGRRDWRRAR